MRVKGLRGLGFIMSGFRGSGLGVRVLRFRVSIFGGIVGMLANQSPSIYDLICLCEHFMSTCFHVVKFQVIFESISVGNNIFRLLDLVVQ